MTDGLQMNLMLDVATFGIFGTKKFPARGQIIKKRANFDLCAGGFAAVANNLDLAAIDDDFRSCNCLRLSRSQAKSRHAGDTWQGFAAKAERGDSLKISSRSDLTGRMPLQRQQRIIAIHSTAVIDYANQRDSPATNDDVNLAGAGVDAVFDQFFHH